MKILVFSAIAHCHLAGLLSSNDRCKRPCITINLAAGITSPKTDLFRRFFLDLINIPAISAIVDSPGSASSATSQNRFSSSSLTAPSLILRYFTGRLSLCQGLQFFWRSAFHPLENDLHHMTSEHQAFSPVEAMIRHYGQA